MPTFLFSIKIPSRGPVILIPNNRIVNSSSVDIPTYTDGLVPKGRRLFKLAISFAVYLYLAHQNAQAVTAARASDVLASSADYRSLSTAIGPEAMVRGIGSAQGVTALVTEPDRVLASAGRAHEGSCSWPGRIQRRECIGRRDKASQRGSATSPAEMANAVLEK